MRKRRRSFAAAGSAAFVKSAAFRTKTCASVSGGVGSGVGRNDIGRSGVGGVDIPLTRLTAAAKAGNADETGEDWDRDVIAGGGGGGRGGGGENGQSLVVLDAQEEVWD